MRNKTQRNAQSPSLLFVRRNCHAQETPHCHVRKEPLPRTLPRQKETLPRTRHHTATSKRNLATHKTPHCHVRKEPLPRTRHHTATSERNPCHAQDTTLPRQKGTPATAGQDFATGKKQFENKKKHLVVTKKHYKKHVLRLKKSREQHLTD